MEITAEVSEHRTKVFFHVPFYHSGKDKLCPTNHEFPKGITFSPGITNIGDYAFGNCASLQSIIVPPGITSVGNSVFYGCSAITNITLPPGITNIGYRAFSGCAKLNGLAIPLQVVNIESSAFSSCESLTDITLPGGITVIGDNTFYYCTLLPSINISTNVSRIGLSAFEGCANLQSVAIPASVTNIGTRAFANCASLSAISVSSLNSNYCTTNATLFSKDQTDLLQCPGAAVGTFTIPDSVTALAEAAFYGCSHLNDITIPNSVTNIGAWAFDDCSALTNIAIPNSVTGIGDVAFRDCLNLTAISVDSLNPVYSSLDGVLFDKAKTNLIQYPAGKTGNYIVPDIVQQIADWAFADCSGLEKITLGSRVTAIGEYAFAGCSNLKTVFFTGQPPVFTGNQPFLGDTQSMIYYLPCHAGWKSTFAGAPTLLWNPQIQFGNQNSQMPTNGFGFAVTGATNLVLVVEACTNLASPVWVPVATNILAGGSSDFTDPDWTNHPSRFYRVSPP